MKSKRKFRNFIITINSHHNPITSPAPNSSEANPVGTSYQPCSNAPPKERAPSARTHNPYLIQTPKHRYKPPHPLLQPHNPSQCPTTNSKPVSTNPHSRENQNLSQNVYRTQVDSMRLHKSVCEGRVSQSRGGDAGRWGVQYSRWSLSVKASP